MADNNKVNNDNDDMRFTDQLQANEQQQWNRVVKHRFTTELAAGTIDRNVLKRYLVQDFCFLDDFVILLASIVAHARTLEDRIPACQFLAVVTSQENTYFHRCFEKLGVTEEERESVPNEVCTTRFCKLMREVALTGSLAEMLSVIVVCEWSYLTWANLVLPRTNRDDFVTYEWVDLHSGKDFEQVVTYLRGLLDKEGQLIGDEERAKCVERFKQALQLEEDFFDMPYKE